MANAQSATERRCHAIVAGGGIAGLETVLALRALAGDRVTVTLVTRALLMVERPVAVAEPFARAISCNHNHDVRALAEHQHVDLILDRLVEVHAEARKVMLASGKELSVDALVVATGAGTRSALPGATTLRRPNDVIAMRRIVDDLRAGRARSVAFVLPGASSWPLPLYELALLTGAELRAERVDGVTITIVTPQAEPLAIFGAAAPPALRPLLADRGVTVRTGSRAVGVEPGRLLLEDGTSIEADRVVALAAPDARAPIGLPTDRDGFVPTDDHGRVAGLQRVYAAGDVTARPLKQGGLAAQQGDTVAEALAAEVGALDEPRPYRPIVRGLLLVGGPPLYLRAELGGVDAATAEPLPGTSMASREALWWPPEKVAADFLSPYFSTARPRANDARRLTDRPAAEMAVAPGDPWPLTR
jgi:sulfide:quinone oxidoreductase